MDRIIRIANEMNCGKMAVDVPSGLDCELGTLSDPTFKADFTCTFVARKIGFKTAEAKSVLGSVQAVSLSIPDTIVEGILNNSDQQP